MADKKNDIKDIEKYIISFMENGGSSSLQSSPNYGMWAIRMADSSVIGGDRYTVLKMKPITKNIIMQIKVEDE